MKPEDKALQGDRIEASVGAAAHNVNVGKDISCASVGDVHGDIRDSSIAGRDVNETTVGDISNSTGVAVGPGASSIVIIQRLDPTDVRNQRNHRILRQLVKSNWVDGVLKHSLYNEVLLRLHLEKRPDAIDDPLIDLILKQPRHSENTVPSGTPIVEVFDAMNQLLLILGEPGSGKTTLLLELAEALLARAEQEPTHPTPVVFNLSSWAQRKQALAKWLADELNTTYRIPKKLAQQWIAHDELLLLLDGLDEVQADHRHACVEAINHFRQDHLVPLVVCSRVAEYERLTVHLQLQGAVFLQPLTQTQVNAYLDQAGAELTAVRNLLQQDPELQGMATSPLLLNIMAFAYEGVAARDLSVDGPRSARRQHLFNAYIKRIFIHRGRASLYTRAQTLNWLRWLAEQMRQRSQTVFLIESLQVRGSVKNRAFTAFSCLMWLSYWMFTGLTGWAILSQIWKWDVGLQKGAIYWIIWGLLCSSVLIRSNLTREIKPVETLALSWNTVRHNISTKKSLTAVTVILLIGLMTIGLTSLAFTLLVSIHIGVYVFYSSLIILAMMGWMSIGSNEEIHGEYVGTKMNSNQGILLSIKHSVIVSSFMATGTVVTLWSMRWLSIELSHPIHGLMLLIGLTANAILIVIVEPRLLYACLSLLGPITAAGAGGDYVIDSAPSEYQTVTESFAMAKGAPIGNPIFAGLLSTANAFFLLGAIGYFNLQWSLLLGVGIAIGVFALLKNGGDAVIRHICLRIVLFAAGHAPCNYARFLDYCHDRIFLRKVGGGYIFIHRMLLEHFAQLTDEDIERLASE